MVFSKQFPKSISTKDLTSFIVTNPMKKDIFCNGIEIVCTPEFTRKGAMIVNVNSVTLYDSRNTQGFLGIGRLRIALNARLENQRNVEIIILNEVDTNEIKCNVNVFIDEENKAFDTSLEYISDEVVNDVVSKTEILFPFRVYNNEVDTILINMEGYKKLIVQLQASTIPVITELVPPNVNDYDVGTGGDLDQLIDSDTAAAINLTTFPNNDSIRILDTKNSNDKNLKIAITNVSGNEIFNIINSRQGFGSNDCALTLKIINVLFNNRTWDIDESDDPTFTTFDVIFVGANDNTLTGGFATTKRYIRFTEKIDVGFSSSSAGAGNSNNCTANNCTNPTGCCITGCNGMTKTFRNIPNTVFTSVFDDLTTNGTASLSFDVRNPELDVFQQLISAAEFGTISEGQVVVAQVGDVNNAGAGGKPFFLPSTQTDFRAKLTIVNGIETGVSIIKVQ